MDKTDHPTSEEVALAKRLLDANGLIGDYATCQRLVWAMRRDPLGTAEMIRVCLPEQERSVSTFSNGFPSK